MNPEPTYRADPPVRPVDWPALLKTATAMRVKVYRRNAFGGL